jgi:hypothetical protein
VLEVDDEALLLKALTSGFALAVLLKEALECVLAL